MKAIYALVFSLFAGSVQAQEAEDLNPGFSDPKLLDISEFQRCFAAERIHLQLEFNRLHKIAKLLELSAQIESLISPVEQKILEREFLRPELRAEITLGNEIELEIAKRAFENRLISVPPSPRVKVFYKDDVPREYRWRVDRSPSGPSFYKIEKRGFPIGSVGAALGYMKVERGRVQIEILLSGNERAEKQDFICQIEDCRGYGLEKINIGEAKASEVKLTFVLRTPNSAVVSVKELESYINQAAKERCE